MRADYADRAKQKKAKSVFGPPRIKTEIGVKTEISVTRAISECSDVLLSEGYNRPLGG